MTLSFFFGTVLRGEPSHEALTNARFLSETSTATKYRLLSVDDSYPALVEDLKGGMAIVGELYELSEVHWQAIVRLDPKWMYRAPIELHDGAVAESMLANPNLAKGVTLTDISAYGGWRNFNANRE